MLQPIDTHSVPIVLKREHPSRNFVLERIVASHLHNEFLEEHNECTFKISINA
jgi:hypothetical protein